MADLVFIDANRTTRFGCYSERGLMSYFMFLVLPEELATSWAILDFQKGSTVHFRS